MNFKIFSLFLPFVVLWWTLINLVTIFIHVHAKWYGSNCQGCFHIVVISCTDVQSRCSKEQNDVLFHIFRNINGSLTLYLYVKYIINKYLIDEKNPFHGVIAPLILGSKIYFSYFNRNIRYESVWRSCEVCIFVLAFFVLLCLSRYLWEDFFSFRNDSAWYVCNVWNFSEHADL